ncbi:MAG: lytic murein transglycosylase [Desulfovibrio sp.]|nr:lytic murein transglycosylase [Desulfovibrio sp.]
MKSPLDYRLGFLIPVLLVCFCLVGAGGTCWAQPVHAVWKPLMDRLAKDGVAGAEVSALFATLPAHPTQSPMGRKIRDLYNKKFFPKPPPKLTDYYPGVVNMANAARCQNYLAAHKASFERAYERYGVEPEIAVALLFVETRLGDVLADVPENAFYTLASMALARTPDDIASYLPKMKGSSRRLAWITKTMQPKADWAYAEVKALIVYMLANGIAPDAMPSSIYGAVGLCQFMPSNIAIYGADGNGDGRIDLFQIDDATASLANYLAKHGWKKGLPRERQHALLMKYNHAKIYANTILALSDLVAAKSPR